MTDFDALRQLPINIYSIWETETTEVERTAYLTVRADADARVTYVFLNFWICGREYRDLQGVAWTVLEQAPQVLDRAIDQLYLRMKQCVYLVFSDVRRRN